MSPSIMSIKMQIRIVYLPLPVLKMGGGQENTYRMLIIIWHVESIVYR